MRGLRLVTGLCMLTLASQLAAQTAHIKKVRISHTGDRTRVVLDLDRPADHKLFTLSSPNRVVVDLARGSFELGGARLPRGDGVVANVRGADRDNGTARLVLDLGTAARPKSFVLGPSGNYGHRVVVDLTPVDAAPVVVKRAPRVEGSRDLVVAIDPGHGGKDPGAQGRGGLVEKTAVLQISKRLAKLVDAEPGMRAVLTRSGDQFLKLRQRRDRAGKANADLFISIHADAFRDRRVSGATVYVLSRKGASDEAADLLAKRENAADLIGGVDIKGKDPMLASVLVDLSQNAALEVSVEVADVFIGEISRIGKMRKRRVQKAGFRVLKSPDIPSILVETGFISNPQEESNLKSAQYQQQLAQAMHKGVKAYFYANPPSGSRIAQLRREQKLLRQHLIRRGDTLSEIAQRYQVSISRIRTENKLSGSRIRVGQVLRIPPG